MTICSIIYLCPSVKLISDHLWNKSICGIKNPCPSVDFITAITDTIPNNWISCILMQNKQQGENFLKQTNETGIMTRPSWRLMNELEMFKDFQTSLC